MSAPKLIDHPIRYPLKAGEVWRSTCTKHPGHWWQVVPAPDQAREKGRAA